MVVGLPTIKGPIGRTIRLVASARLRAPVLEGLVGTDLAELAKLAEIEAVTSGRLETTRTGLPPLGPDAFASPDVPSHHFINAAFVYPRPEGLNRFNGPARGAWYAALELDTALAEVAFHIEKELLATNRRSATVEYAELFATIDGSIIDLTANGVHHPCINAADEVAYVEGNQLAAEAMHVGIHAIKYPSARYAGGICIAALFPKALSGVAEGDVHRLSWSDYSLSIERSCNKALQVP